MTLKLKFARLKSKPLSRIDLTVLSAPDRQTITYIKAKSLIDLSKHMIYRDNDMLFLVNKVSQEVILSHENDKFYLNKELSKADFNLAMDLKDLLDSYFRINILYEDFAVDLDTGVIYIGQGAIDYKEDLIHDDRVLN